MHLNQMTEKSNNLKCFSKAHFICQDAIHTVLIQQLKQTGTSVVKNASRVTDEGKT